MLALIFHLSPWIDNMHRACRHCLYKKPSFNNVWHQSFVLFASLQKQLQNPILNSIKQKSRSSGILAFTLPYCYLDRLLSPSHFSFNMNRFVIVFFCFGYNFQLHILCHCLWFKRSKTTKLNENIITFYIDSYDSSF